MKSNTLNPKLLGFSILLAIIAIAISITMYLQVVRAAGFTGPTSAPPAGDGVLAADSSGNLGIGTAPVSGIRLTVNGIIDAVSNRIIQVADPVDGTDAANRQWVLAQVASGGYYTRSCKWDTISAGVPFGSIMLTGSCILPPSNCDGTDIDLGTDIWTNAIDFEEESPSIYNAIVSGVEVRVCKAN